MAVLMKGKSNRDSLTVKEKNLFQMVMYILANSKMICLMEKAYTNGRMAQFMKVAFSKTRNTVWDIINFQMVREQNTYGKMENTSNR